MASTDAKINIRKVYRSESLCLACPSHWMKMPIQFFVICLRGKLRSLVCGHMPVVPALGRQRQQTHRFEASKQFFQKKEIWKTLPLKDLFQGLCSDDDRQIHEIESRFPGDHGSVPQLYCRPQCLQRVTVGSVCFFTAEERSLALLQQLSSTGKQCVFSDGEHLVPQVSPPENKDWPVGELVTAIHRFI